MPPEREDEIAREWREFDERQERRSLARKALELRPISPDDLDGPYLLPRAMRKLREKHRR